MIKINLLPPEIQGKKGQRKKAAAGGGQINPVVAGVLTFLLFLVVLAAWGYVGYYGIYSKIDTAKKEAEIQKKKHDSLDKELKGKRDKHAVRLAKWNLMQNQKEILQELKPEKRLLWSEKLNMLSNLTPKDVYITQIEVFEDVEMVETDASKKRREEWTAKKQEIENAILDRPEKGRRIRELGAEPRPVEKPLITQTLVIKATTLLREDGADRIDKAIEFQKNMQDYVMVNAKGEQRYFRDFFEKDVDSSEDEEKLKITPGPMQETILDGVPVWSFEFSVSTERPEGATGKARKQTRRR